MTSTLLLCLFIIFLKVINCENPNCFRAATYEHIKIQDPIDRPLELLYNNFAIYEKVIRKASWENANLIVLPEYGMHSFSDKAVVLSSGVSAFVPDLNTNLCEAYKHRVKDIKNSNLTKQEKGKEIEKLNNLETEQIDSDVRTNVAILRKFSCLASKHEIAIAVDLISIEKIAKQNSTTNQQNANSIDDLTTSNPSDSNGTIDDYKLYNTLVVFDQQGKLVAKYRKYHLFGESQVISRPEVADITTFENKFGKFGMAICADILFEDPIKTLVEKEKIDHLIFSTAWFDEHPSLAALNYHTSVSIKYGKKSFCRCC